MEPAATGTSFELTTSEAARLAGVSRQHVVDLCDRGVLPHRMVGTHRRLRAHDVLGQLTSGSTSATPPMTRKDRLSLAIHCTVAVRLLEDEDATRRRALRNIETMRRADRDGAAKRYIDEWARLLEGPIENLLSRLLALDHRARDLRNVTPFAGVVSDQRRRQLLSRIT